MRYYEATSTIAASPEAAWAVLGDGTSWPERDPGVDALEGRTAVYESVKIRSQAASGRAFPVRVTRSAPPAYLRSSGGMPLGLFRGVRAYEVSEGADGRVTFRMREEYSGPLLPLIWRSMPGLEPSFQRFAHGLRQRVEPVADRDG